MQLDLPREEGPTAEATRLTDIRDQRTVRRLSLYGSRRLPRGMGQFSIVIKCMLTNDRGGFS